MYAIGARNSVRFDKCFVIQSKHLNKTFATFLEIAASDRVPITLAPFVDDEKFLVTMIRKDDRTWKSVAHARETACD